MAPDNAKGVRNVSLRFGLSDNETWRWATTPYAYSGASAQQELLDALVSLTPNAEIKKANANKVKDFVNANPEVLLQGKYVVSQNIPAGFWQGQSLRCACLRLHQRGRQRAAR